jgi:hypothetical protein
VRHAGEELGLQSIRLLHLVRLPEQLRVLFLEVARRRANAILEVDVEPLELLVQPLVLDLLPQVVKGRYDRNRLAALVQDLSGDDLHRQDRMGARIRELHPRLRRPGRRELEVRDERRELRVVPPDGRLLLPRRRVAAGLEEPLRLLVHQDDLRVIVRHEDRVGDVLENQVQPVPLSRCLQLCLTHALHLAFELVRRAPQIGHVAQHRQDRVLRPDTFTQRMREHLEQQVASLVRIHEIQLTRVAAAQRAGPDHRRAR